MANAIIERVGGVGVDCDDATTTTAQVLSGKTFGGSASDEIQTGDMANQGKKTYTISTNNGSVDIPQGYHDGTGKVTYSLPSVNGGNTYTPTAANQSITLSGKYLKSNITVSGSSNLVAGNIRSGKNIWGVGGSFVNFDDVSRVYNGSAFSGWMNGGVVLNPRGFGTFGSFNDWCKNESTNVSYPSGSLYLEKTDSASSSGTFGREEEYAARLVSAKSMDFSHFSRIRVTGTYTATIRAVGSYDGTRFGHPYIGLHLRFYECTNDSGSISRESYGTTLHSDRIDTTEWRNSVTKTISFDLQDDISSWSENQGFLLFKVWNDGYDNTEGYYLYSKCVITGIWLYA